MDSPTTLRASGAANTVAWVRLMNGPVVEQDGRPVRLSRYQQYLVSLVFGDPAGSLSRKRAIWLLWEEPDEAAQRHRLSQILYSLRKKLSCELIEADGELLRPTLAIGNHDGPNGAKSGARFLAGLTRSPTKSFEEWWEAERSRRESSARRSLMVQYDEAITSGDLGRLRAATTALIAMEPAEQTYVRGLARAAAFEGGSDAGIEVIQHYIDSTGRPLHNDTSELLARLEVLGLTTHEDAPLVGRSEELDRAVAALRPVWQGGDSATRVVAIRGPAGIGKSRFLRELRSRLTLHGALVLTARCTEFERGIPLSPIVDLFSGPEAGAAAQRLREPWRSVVFGVLPDHAGDDHDFTSLPYIEPGETPRRLFEAITRLTEELSRERPVVLEVDDLHWADDTTRAALSFLNRRWRNGRLGLVVSVRDEPASLAAEVSGLLDRDDRPTAWSTLSRLSDSSARELVESIIPLVDGRLTEETVRLGGGNPLFLTELAQEALAGRLSLETLASGDGLPSSVVQILSERLDTLSESEAHVVELLSALARPTTLPQLADLSRTDLVATARNAEKLHSLRLVALDAGELSIPHELIRLAAYSRLSSSSRSLIHGAVAEYFESTNSGSAEELARHFDLAGVRPKALRYALEAAEVAEANGAVSEATSFLSVARRNNEDEALDTQLVGRLAKLHYLHLNRSEAIPLLELAADRYRRAEEVEEALGARIRRINLLRRSAAWAKRDLLEELTEIKAAARAACLYEVLAQALHAQIMIHEQAMDFEGAAAVFKEAEWCVTVGSARAQCLALGVLAHQVLLGTPPDAVDHARKGAQIAEDEGFDDLVFRMCNGLLSALVAQGRLHSPEGRDVLARAHRVAEVSGDLAQRFTLHCNQAVWLIDTGDYATAEAHLERVECLLLGSGGTSELAVLYLNIGEARLLGGKYELAEAAFEKAEKYILDEANLRHSWIREAGPGLCALRLGKLAEASRRLERLPPPPEVWAGDPTIVGIFQSEMLRLRRQAEEAAALLADLALAVSTRFPVHSIRLRIEEARIRKSFDRPSGIRVAQAAMQEANGLGLRIHTESLARLSERPMPPLRTCAIISN